MRSFEGCKNNQKIILVDTLLLSLKIARSFAGDQYFGTEGVLLKGVIKAI